MCASWNTVARLIALSDQPLLDVAAVRTALDLLDPDKAPEADLRMWRTEGRCGKDLPEAYYHCCGQMAPLGVV
jgi:hypothetical protein